MNKGKIIGLSNTEDSLWFKLSPGDETLKQIDLIFDIYDNLYEDDDKEIHSYAYHTDYEELCFHKETTEFIVYFIFTKNIAHVILRKALNWKKYNEDIHKTFDFVK